MLKNKNASSWIALALSVLAVILAIFGLATTGLVRDSFPVLIVVFLILGAVCSCVSFLINKMDFMDLPAVLFYGLAVGLIFKDGIEVLVYQSIGIDNNVGGNGSLVSAYLAIGCVLVVIAVVKNFLSAKKS